ncbi:Mg2+-importing ATPase [Phyllobacterium myrsinacearum]|uniref:Magnesium-transporting ATPase, P-type 1 n=2 Tax=Phyllobacterium myrsinacearum TaxID=28101 RepID=A0A839ETI9_9HYPH|nr:Mg2+-importing ATPase [Phyllobacterium myrsinacearum]
MLATKRSGLSAAEAKVRLTTTGPNSLVDPTGRDAFTIFARQFRSPLVLILVFAAGLSALVGEGNEAIIIATIVLASCVLSFTQEYGASRAVEALKQAVARKTTALRDGQRTEVLATDIVPGDIINLSAGNLIPADSIVIEARDFNVSESALTGETFPAVKSPGVTKADAGLSSRNNCIFTGTSVRSGTATALVIKTGQQTEFAHIAAAIERQIPETDFARGIRRFGYLMTEIMLAIVILVLVANLLLHRPLIDSLLFSLALAVGLTPELLPAIISVTLARGARSMAKNGVIVRRLEAIENLGSMDLLCTDKTGTLTEGVIHLDGCFDVRGKASPDVLLWACLNATLQTGLNNPLDEAIAAAPERPSTVSNFAKVDEIPYDFSRKRLSVIVTDKANPGNAFLICKGAVQNVLEACSTVLAPSGGLPLDEAARASIDVLFKNWSNDGYRVLGLATRTFPSVSIDRKGAEAELTFAGFLLFLDPPKPGIAETIADLAQKGVATKVITGDNRYVASHLAASIGLRHELILTGEDMGRLTKNALFGAVARIDIFAEIDPNQKERIIDAYRRRGHVVGYLGDGINDAPALHTADIGISVNGAVDVAREAADIILLERDLGVLLRGIDSGRRTFANTMKYISITTSANFGNMISMAFASLFLPFLPLLAQQILLNNLLYSVPSLAIAGDNVDPEDIAAPRQWDIKSVRRFMISFGLVSSAFDFLTFGYLVYFVQAAPETFRTAWFVESLLTQLAIVMIVRTHNVAWKSKPSPVLFGLTVLTAASAIAIPYLPMAPWFGFVPMPLPLILGLLAISTLYLVVSEGTKRWFFSKENKRIAGKRPKPFNVGGKGAKTRHAEVALSGKGAVS